MSVGSAELVSRGWQHAVAAKGVVVAAALLAEGLRLVGLAGHPGERWTLVFDSRAVSLTNSKGLHDLATLLARPNEEVHYLELAGRPAEPGGHDPMLDERARREYRARVEDLQREIDAADRANDLARGMRGREELDALIETLSGALGIGGRSRGLGSAAERARSAVTWRIRSAIKKIAAANPQLGRHFDNSIRTGTFCTYAPEQPIDWQL